MPIYSHFTLLPLFYHLPILFNQLSNTFHNCTVKGVGETSHGIQVLSLVTPLSRHLLLVTNNSLFSLIHVVLGGGGCFDLICFVFVLLLGGFAVVGGGGLNLIRISNGGDLEPGRCRRTMVKDGGALEMRLLTKNVASATCIEATTVQENLWNVLPKTTLTRRPALNPILLQMPLVIQSALNPVMCLDWIMKGEQWQSGSVFTNQHMVVSFENQHQIEAPIRGFIDAWSNGVSDNNNNDNTNSGNIFSNGNLSLNTNSGNIFSNGNLSLSPLSLSMGGSITNDDEMGLGVPQTGHQDHECSTSSSTKLPFSSWLPPAIWVASTPEGPLAEVLRPSTVNGDSSSSPQATTLSSPSGVLQKALAASSWSDSSGSSSLTLGSSNANNKPVELALLWLNQGKLASSTRYNIVRLLVLCLLKL